MYYAIQNLYIYIGISLIASWKPPAIFYALTFLVYIKYAIELRNYVVNMALICQIFFQYIFLIRDVEINMKAFLKLRYDNEIKSKLIQIF